MMISVRRFSALPAALELVDLGRVSPNPLEIILFD
jgi:hypothetical protein